MFIDDGRIVLDSTMESLSERYSEVHASGDDAQKAAARGPIYQQEMFGKSIMIFEDGDRESFKQFGEVRTPDIADLFVAKVKGRRK